MDINAWISIDSVLSSEQKCFEFLIWNQIINLLHSKFNMKSKLRDEASRSQSLHQ